MKILTGGVFRSFAQYRYQFIELTSEPPETPSSCAIITCVYKPGTFSFASIAYGVTMEYVLGYSLPPSKTQASGKGKSVPICFICVNCCASLHAENLQICWNSMETASGSITALKHNLLRSCV